MTSTASQLSGFAIANKSIPQTARFFRLTFPEKGKPLLTIGPGDHTSQTWLLNMDEVRMLVLDAMPELLGR